MSQHTPTRSTEKAQAQRSSKLYLMFILWVLKPSKGSSTRLVARSSVSHSSFTLILVHPSIASHHQHAVITQVNKIQWQQQIIVTSVFCSRAHPSICKSHNISVTVACVLAEVGPKPWRSNSIYICALPTRYFTIPAVCYISHRALICRAQHVRKKTAEYEHRSQTANTKASVSVWELAS